MNRKILFTVWLLCCFLIGARAIPLTDGQTIKIYSGKAPGTENWQQKEYTLKGGDGYNLVFNVTEPTLTAYVPQHPNGTCMLVCPGGGFCMLSIDTEGEMVARELNKWGITAFVLKYRLNPMTDDAGKNFTDVKSAAMRLLLTAAVAKKKVMEKKNISEDEVLVTDWCAEVPSQPFAFADARQAMTLIRQHAGEWGIKQDHIGIMGFSAGAITAFHQTLVNDAASRPDFTAIIYGGWTAHPAVPAQAGPLFLCSPVKDIFKTEESLNIFNAWKEAQKPVELHYFSDCEHGFGAKTTGKNVDSWMELLHGFMVDNHFVN
jgi:acetyl esterase/lipase